jgi:putative transposase
VKYAFIQDHRKEFNVALMCEVLKASRAGFYSWKNRVDGAKEKRRYDLQRQIEKVFLSSRNTYGSPRIFQILKGMGYNVSKNTVARMMREMELSPNKKRRFKVKTTDSNHRESIAPNILKQSFNTSKPNEVWLSDLTYIATQQGWL